MTASGQLLLTSESVTEGHPDKICDQISDAVLDACLVKSPLARVACETAIKSDESQHWAAVFGETTPHIAVSEVEALVRSTLTDIGYTDVAFGTSADEVHVEVLLSSQSADIAQGVDQALEAREGELDDDLDTGAGDQGMMFGFASDETAEYMPLPIVLAHRLTKRLAEARKDGTIEWLRPDGKSQVSVEYVDGVPHRISAIVVSTQHAPEIQEKEIRDAVLELIIEPVLPSALLDQMTNYFVNPTGRFVVGGPFGDAGLTGRKIMVDTYGGLARHGGGAFSGKDPTKVDRSGAYAARWVAKNVVAAGLAKRCEVQIAYAIGVARPVSVAVETFGTERIGRNAIAAAIHEVFDLRPAAIIKDLDLRRPIYRQTATYGHFGRVDLDVPWESIGRAAALRVAAGA
ncbi:MAG TPA: methionine adenosyltransferase [Acidimicrobiales bacterium]|nr:methionine adenosyltransferase [Acidimicrobiales bacterium]